MRAHRQHRTPGADSTTGPLPGRASDDVGGPPRRSKVVATLAVLACAACCALPVLIGAGLLTGAGAALAEQVLPAMAGLLVAAAAGMWWLHRRKTARAARGSIGAACDPSGCGCGGC
ncbi:hypothetical protein [Sphaerisporangium sp. NPDC051011]|uniref:hypothetical protein n=1 Tax=Sphaerisporangium sp. NPDC051011 TaxID=3155792 RepID=UPI0034044941